MNYTARTTTSPVFHHRHLCSYTSSHLELHLSMLILPSAIHRCTRPMGRFDRYVSVRLSTVSDVCLSASCRKGSAHEHDFEDQHV
jgi:hypothetical protein